MIHIITVTSMYSRVLLRGSLDVVSSSVTELLVIVRVLPLLRLNAGLRTSHVLAKDRTGLTFICFKASGRLITSRCSGNEPVLLL